MSVTGASRGLVVVIAGSIAVLCLIWTRAAIGAVPSPCTVLTAAKPQLAFAPGKTVVIGKQTLTSYGSGKYLSKECKETVGSQVIWLTVSAVVGGFGGVKVTSETHPTGFEGSATLVVGTGFGSPSTPVVFINFHQGSVYASISANGANPAVLTKFAHTVAKLLA